MVYICLASERWLGTLIRPHLWCMKCRMNKINFLISLTWAEGDKDVGDTMPRRSYRIRLRLRPSAHSREFEKKMFFFIWDSIYRDSVCIISSGQTNQIYEMRTGRRYIHFTDLFMCEFN